MIREFVVLTLVLALAVALNALAPHIVILIGG